MRSGASILLVDDAEPVRLMKSGLIHRGYRVRVALDEEDAVGLARRSSPGLILLELGTRTPIDVLSVGVRIREEAGLSHDVPVVVCANKADEAVGEGEVIASGNGKYVILSEDGEQWGSFLSRLLAERSRNSSAVG